VKELAKHTTQAVNFGTTKEETILTLVFMKGEYFRHGKSEMLWDICVREIHFIKYSLYRHVSEMEQFNEICILAYQNLPPPVV
jgi:hypothetical protein